MFAIHHVLLAAPWSDGLTVSWSSITHAVRSCRTARAYVQYTRSLTGRRIERKCWSKTWRWSVVNWLQWRGVCVGDWPCVITRRQVDHPPRRSSRRSIILTTAPVAPHCDRWSVTNTRSAALTSAQRWYNSTDLPSLFNWHRCTPLPASRL